MADEHTALQRSMAGLAADIHAALERWQATVAEGASAPDSTEDVGPEEQEAIFAACREMTRETALLCSAVEAMKSSLSRLRAQLGIRPHCPCHACAEEPQPAAPASKPTPKGTGMLH